MSYVVVHCCGIVLVTLFGLLVRTTCVTHEHSDESEYARTTIATSTARLRVGPAMCMWCTGTGTPVRYGYCNRDETTS